MTTAQGAIAPFAEQAKKLAEKGFSVLPLDGKRPFFKGWTEFCHRQPSEQELDEWVSRYPNKNIGVTCGAASRLIVLDFDTLDEELHRKTKEIIPPSPVLKRGEKPFAAFYKYEGQKSLKIRKPGNNKPEIEILSDGNQTVLPPSIHPDTGRPYRYLTPNTLLDINPEELPSLPQSVIAQLVRLVEGEAAPLSKPTNSRPPMRVVAAGDSHKSALRSALTFRRVLDHFNYSKTSSIEDTPEGFKCSSPWNTDSNPSCCCNENEKVFNDFSSGKSGDVFDFIAALGGWSIPENFSQVMRTAEIITGVKRMEGHQMNKPVLAVSNSLERREIKKQVPIYEDYAAFFHERLGVYKRDLIGGELNLKEKDGRWQIARSKLSVFISHALDTGFLKKADMAEHFARFEDEQEKQLLVDIPEWDGVDRVKTIASCLHATNISQEHMEEFIKDWGAKIFGRIENSENTNRLLCLKGGQGIGKDYLIRALVGGLDDYMSNMTITNNENDNLTMLADHIVLNISEFDRTARTEVATLKDWIDKRDATIRRPYARSHIKHQLHCSFIASANVEAHELLRDPTGNRRYIIFELESINWNYPTDQSLQILAQFKALWGQGFKASQEAEAVMKAYIAEKTPEDPTQALLEEYDARLLNLEKGRTTSRFKIDEISETLTYLAGTYRVAGIPKLQQILRANGRSKRLNTGVIYFRPENSPK